MSANFEKNCDCWNPTHDKTVSRYGKVGKKTTPLTDKDFIDGMEAHYFVKEDHKGFVALLYYIAVRKSEALKGYPGTIRDHKNESSF